MRGRRCGPLCGSGSHTPSKNTTIGRMSCLAAISRNLSTRSKKPSRSSCHGNSCRNTRTVLKPIDFGPAELAVDRLGIERVGLPHFELVDRRAGEEVAADEPGLGVVPLVGLLGRPALGGVGEWVVSNATSRVAAIVHVEFVVETQSRYKSFHRLVKIKKSLVSIARTPCGLAEIRRGVYCS